MATRKQQFKAVQQEGLELFTRKNRDYGDAFADYGVVGVLVRMGDKIRRLQNISTTGVTLVEDESFRDTLIDLHNYAAMAVLLLDSDENMDSVAEKKDEVEAVNVIVNESGSHAKHTWRVPSASVKEEYEVVQYHDGTMSCTCKGFEYHGWCHHCIRKKGENARNAREVQSNKCRQNKENGTHTWFVQCSSDRSKQYEVTRSPNGEMTCTCEGFKYYNWCKHCEQHKN